MKLRTIRLPILCVVAGMTLAAAVQDRAGRMLFAAGTELDEDMLDRLNKRGIESLAVQIVDTRDAFIIDEEVRTAQERVRYLFRGSGSSARAVLQAELLAYRDASLR